MGLRVRLRKRCVRCKRLGQLLIAVGSIFVRLQRVLLRRGSPRVGSCNVVFGMKANCVSLCCHKSYRFCSARILLL